MTTPSCPNTPQMIIMDKPKKTPFLFRLLGSSIDQFAVFEKNNTDVNAEFDFESEVNIEYDVHTRIFKCQATVECNKLGKPVAKMSLTYRFEIAPESAEQLRVGDKVILSKEILTYFCSKTYEGLRGALIAKLEPTSLRITLPLVNLADLIGPPLEVPVNC